MPAELNGREKNPKAGGLTLSDINTYYEATVIVIKCYLGKDKQTDQLNRTENIEIHPYIYTFY